jgi:glutathione S-transferase
MEIVKKAAIYGFGAVSAIFQFFLGVPVLGRIINVLLAVCAMLCRLGAGTVVASGLDECKRPTKTLILYEYEACPFCRKVREAMTTLDLDCIIYPCPRETFKAYGVVKESRYRPKVMELGGKGIFPFLVDPNTDKKMYESEKIVAYLWETYGNKATAPWNDRVANIKAWKLVGLAAASAFRAFDVRFGMLRTPSKCPKEPLELWGTEASAFCKIAREALCTLELPYKLVNVGIGSTKKRAEFREKYSKHLSGVRKAAGVVMIPLLIDPNTNTTMVESADIVDYLFKEYQTGETVKEDLTQYTTNGATALHGTVPFMGKKSE